MKAVPLIASLVALAPIAAAASTIGPIIDLPLAALIGVHDPALSPAQRRELTALADGKTVAQDAPIEVTASAIACSESNVAIGERSCELTFGTRKATLTGLKAHEMTATLKEAGAASDGAAGSIHTGLTDLRCSVSPLQILAKAGGGASCTFAPAK